MQRNSDDKPTGAFGRSRAAIAAAVVSLAALLIVAGPAAAEDPLSELSDRLEKMKPPEQIDHLRGLLEQGMTDARIHFFLGNAYFAVEQYDSAASQFQTAVALDEQYAKAFVNMGITYDTMGDWRKARAAYESAIAINPEDVLAYCHIGFNYYSRRETGKAMDYYAKALAVDPNSAQAHYNLGLAFANAKIFREALTEWRKVIELDPEGELGKIATENVRLIQTYMELDE